MPAPEPGDDVARKFSFCYPGGAYRGRHLHVVEHGSAGSPAWLPFRDHLRTHPAYWALKVEPARADDTDRPRHRAGKAPFIEGVLRRI